MKMFDSLRSMIVYQQNGLLLPKGEKTGFGCSVFLVSPNKTESYKTLTDSFLKYQKGLYKFYMIDFVYKEKLGYKKYLQNNTGAFKKEFSSTDFPATLTMVTNGNKANIMKQKRNLVVDLGEWLKLYFQYQIKGSNEKICTNFMQFLGKHTSDLSDYRRILYINMDQWLTETNKLALDRKHLTNPISILLVSLYKFPEILSAIYGMDIILVSPSQYKVMRIKSDDLIKKNYPRLKQKIMGMVREIVIDHENMNEETVLDGKPVVQKPIDQMTSDEVVASMKSKELAKEEQKKNMIINSLTRNLLGSSEDITGEDSEEVETDDEEVNEIKNLAKQILDEKPELLSDTDPNIALKEVIQEVKKRKYIKEYTPKYSDKKLKEIQKLANQQIAAIGDIDKEIKDLETKVITKSDFSNAVKTTNPNITESKFVNFDRSYNEKKMESDIDNAVGMLSNAAVKVFVIDKKEEDTSTPLDLKKTMTYTLQDENGRKMTLKFDIPIIFDDHFMMIKGNKKIIQHTLILKPLVKTNKDAVQITTNYQKMFVLRKGSVDLKTNALLRFLLSNQTEFNVVTGNGVVTNKKYTSTLEYNGIAKKIVQFRIDENLFILDTLLIDKLVEEGKLDISKVDHDNEIMIGVDKNGKIITMDNTKSYVDTIFGYMPPEYVEAIQKIGTRNNAGKLLMYSKTKPLQKEVPLVLLLLYFEGFSTVMKKAGIEYEVIPKTDDPLDVDLFEWGVTEMLDGYIKWKRYPMENSLLMNGLNPLPMQLYSIEDLDNKDTYTALMTNIYNYANQAFNLDQYYDFMIDPITKEILEDMHLPTDLVSLALLANKMLISDEATPESDLRNMRLRSNEIIAYHTYKAITDAYRQFRTSQHKRVPSPVSVKQDAVIRGLLGQPASAMNDAASLNPVLEITKLRAVTYKGENGTNQDHAFKLNIRAYNDTMLGVMGITTSPDSNVGINRQLTLEPNIASTRGYIDVAGKENVEDLNSAQLLSPTELLTPLGAQHDDPTRTSMAYKQTMQMLLIDNSDSTLIGNGVEKILPYHLSSEFVINAEDEGEVVEKTDEFMVIQYKNGKYRTIDMTVQMRKNSLAGFYIESKMITNLNVGDKFDKNTIVAWDNKAFNKNGNDKNVAMRLGPLMKIAIIPEWDIYEDSAPVTHAASEKMTTTMVMPVTVSLNKDAMVSKIVKVGDTVNAGESVIVFDDYHEDADVAAFIRSLREELGEQIIEENSNRKKTHYTGTVTKIDFLTTVPLEELSPSLQAIAKENWKLIKRREKILNKYKNPDDLNYYKSGNVITETTDPVKPDYQGKVKGQRVDEGVLITFYISFKDILSRGDKISAEFALKSITSHVIDKGLEPYSEFHPEESIDMITAPLSISARKTPSIFIAMFGNKIMIEAKRHLQDYWKNN